MIDDPREQWGERGMILEDHAIPLAGVDPELAADDLDALLRRLDGARVVGLGEATHGDRESFLFKHRMVRVLVRERGFTVLLFERGPAEMDAYDRYVTGESDVLPMGPEIRPWQTEEVRDLFVWLQEWNAGRAPGERVRVAGTVAHSGNGLRLALRLLEWAGTTAPSEWRRLAEEFPGRLRDQPWVEGALERWRAAMPPHEDLGRDGRWISLLAGTFPQWLEVWSGLLPPERSWQVGDRHMAENALAQLERIGPRAKAAFWAHNHHLWLEPERAGVHLRAHLGGGVPDGVLRVRCGCVQRQPTAAARGRQLGSQLVPPPRTATTSGRAGAPAR